MNFKGKLIIKGKIKVVTGLHIGTGSAGGIGLIDNPIIRDPITQQPIIPGSSLKGRLRHALIDIFNDDKHDFVLRLFGYSTDKPKDDEANKTRLYVRDSKLTDNTFKTLESMDLDSLYAEIKTENVINRVSGAGEHPRQAERLPAGAELDFEMVYNAYESNEIQEDLNNIKQSLKYVEDEYLGGSGSRGYGQVEFEINKIEWRSMDFYKDENESKVLLPVNDLNKQNWTERAMELINAKLPVST